MQESLLYILNNYLNASTGPYGGNPMANFIRRSVPQIFSIKASIDTTEYLIEGSAGRGNWAEIPWIAIFDKKITTTATKGYDIVYLFRADMSGVYLSLNQGWTFFKEKYGMREGKEKIRHIAKLWHSMLNSALNDFSLENIELHCNNTLGQGYELGHICGKFYPIDAIPSNMELINDLRNLLGVYREIRGYIGNRSIDEMTDFLLNGGYILETNEEEPEDQQYQRAISLSIPSKTSETPHNRPAKAKIGDRNVWTRNPSVAHEALELANYECEVDSTHKTFVSNNSGKNFVEAHHLIPMKLQDIFEFSLDVPGNIVALCPNCHRAIHHAVIDKKKRMLTLLYQKRREKLSKYGVAISLEQLIQTYK